MSDGRAITLDAAQAPEVREQRQDLRRILRELVRNKAALAGLLVLGLVAASAVLAPLVAPTDPTAQEITSRLKPPGEREWLPPPLPMRIPARSAVP